MSELFLNFHENFQGRTNPRELFIFGDTGEVVTVQNGNGFNQTATLNSDGFAIVEIPASEGMNGTGVNNLGFQITSENAIQAYFSNRSSATTDLTIVFDKSSLGTEYVLSSFGDSIGEGGQFSVQATEDNTTVDVTLPDGQTFSQIINAGETFKFATGGSNSSLGISVPLGFDLTGTLIQTTAAAAVFSGHSCTNVGSGACDHIVEQMPPVNVLSNSYIVGEAFKNGSGNNLVRVVAAKDSTQVTVDGSVVATLNAGQSYDFTLSNNAAQITTSEPALVAQYLQGASTAGEGDPAMMFVPGQDAWLQRYKLATPAGDAAFEDNLVNVVIPTTALSSLELNGAAVDTSGFVPVGSSGFSVGNLEIAPGLFTMEASEPFQVSLFGYDSFDSYLTFGAATFANSINNPPVAVLDTVTTDEDTSITIDVLANDTDAEGDTLTITAVDDTATTGSVTTDGINVIYNPDGEFDYLNAGESATDTFTYTIDDGNGGTDNATVTVTVEGVNDAPVANDDTATTDEDSSITIDALTNDTDVEGNTLTITAVDDTATTGTVTTDGVDVTYNPDGQFDYLNAGESATDTFTYTISDGNGGTDTATVTVTVDGVNDAPVANDDTATTDEETNITIDVLANDTDAEGNTLTITGVDDTGTIGTVTTDGVDVFYHPDGQFDYLNAGENATDTFTYTIDDGNGGTDTATVTVTVDGVNNRDLTDEPNDTIGEAICLPKGSGSYFYKGFIGDNPNVAPSDDVDLIKVELNAGARAVIDINAREYGSALDSVLRVFDSAGNEVAFNDDYFVNPDSYRDSFIDFTASVTDTYYIGVSSYHNFEYDPFTEGSDKGYTSGEYDISIFVENNDNGSISGTKWNDVNGDGIRNAVGSSTIVNTIDDPDGLNPDQIDVQLVPGDDLTFDITVTVPTSSTSLPLDFVLLQDLSGSFSDDVSTVSTLVPNLVSSVLSIQPDTTFGVTSFVDKPISPFGSSSDYVYQTDLALTNDTSLFQTTVDNLVVLSGGDGPESQLEALMQVALRETEVGYRPGSRRVVLLTTDANYHAAGDGTSAGITTPNNGDDILDGAGIGEDYPDIDQVRSALISANIVPIFAVTSSQISTYQNLVSQLGFGVVEQLTSDSSNLVDAITSGLDSAFQDIVMVAESDDYGYVESITPGSYSDVPEGESRTFTVTLDTDTGPVIPDTITLRALGFGETEVNVGTAMESGLGGVEIYLDLNNNGVLDLDEPSTFTATDDPNTPEDETGYYEFTGLSAGEYIVREVVPSGYVQTSPIEGFHQISLAADENVTDIDFGNRLGASDEPNDTIFEAILSGVFGPGSFSYTGFIGDNPNVTASADVDFFEFFADAGERVTIDIDAYEFGSSLDPILRLFDSAGNEVAFNDDFGSLDSFIDFTASVSDSYYVGVSGFSNSGYDPFFEGSGFGGSIGNYDISIVVVPDGEDFIGETGSINSLTDTPLTINLARDYVNPVVFAQPLSYNGTAPATVRLDNITTNSFDVWVQEPNNEDGIHGAENLSFMVLEAGTWELADGTVLEVGTTESAQLVANGWETVSFDADFDSNPVVMSQVQTFNGADFVRTRQDDITGDGFLVGMEEEEANATSGHANETIGYMAMSGGSGNWSGLNYTAGYTGDNVTDAWKTVNFGAGFSETPQVLASLASYDGADPAGIRYRNLNNNQVQFKVEEDTSADAEMAHTSENVSFLAIEGSGLLSASPLSMATAMGETGSISNLTHTARTINLSRDYVNPVVFAQPLSYNGSAPATVRLDNITSNSFTVSVQEPNNEDGSHAAENLSFMVLEAGTWELENGTVLEVGTTESAQLVAQGWETVDFNADFDNTPVVMSQVQTFNGADFVRTRQDDITGNGFLVGMEEEEANKDSGHINETIGYMAISGGSGNWSGLNYTAGYSGDRITDAWGTVNFGSGFSETPQVLASLASYDGADPAGIRYRNLNNNQVQFKVEEDTSADAEMAHTSENVSFLAIEGSGILEAVNVDPLLSGFSDLAVDSSSLSFV